MFKIIIFGYNFPHSKCENFLHILKKNNIKISAYIGANKIKLNLPKKIYNKDIPIKPIFEPRKLCEIYNIPFYVSDHNSDKTIKIIESTKANLGIIAGSRILKSNIIKTLKNGIINFHPGKIPEVSGLDALLWSISKNIKPHVTTHFIDNKIDAGKRIFEREVKINLEDRIEDIKHKISLVELEELEKICNKYLKKNDKIKSNKILNYQIPNKPMKESQQIKVLKKLNSWKRKLYEN